MSVPIEVVGAVIRRGDRLLIAQRLPGKSQELLWEFPGGKVEPGETPERSLVREIKEELGVAIVLHGVVGDVTHDYDGRVIHLTCYWAEVVEGEPHPIECHAIAWVKREDLVTVTFAPADVPIVRRLLAAPDRS